MYIYFQIILGCVLEIQNDGVLVGSVVLNPSLLHYGYWKIVGGECVLERVHLQRVEGTPCQSEGCSHTEGSESLRSGSCIIE